MIDKTQETIQLQEELEQVIGRLPTRAPIYLPTERVPLPQQVEGLKVVDEIYRERLASVYAPRLRALRAQYRNSRRAFIIGNGPSLLKTDLSALKNEVTFAVNGFFLKMPELDWEPTFYAVEDHLVAEDRADAINAIVGPTKLFPAYLAYCINERPDTIFFNHRPRKSYPHGFDFSMDVAAITYTGCTVTNTVMQIAHYLGFRELYLIGVDASYDIPADVEAGDAYSVGVLDMKSDDPNHFHPDYFGKGYRWHDPQVAMMVQAYGEAERTTRRSGRIIYNATVGGKLEVFQRIDFYDVLGHASRDAAAEPDDPARVAALAAHPRLVVIDMTRAGDGSATGEIKATLFRDWPKEHFMQMFGIRDQIGLSFSVDGSTWSADPVSGAELAARIAAFRPEVILYRPVADKPALHDEAMRLIADLDVPVALWIMDDWMQRLAAADPARAEVLDTDLRTLIDRAGALFAISQPMASALSARYGGTWQVFANAIDPADWEMAAAPKREPDSLLIRYAGGLAEDMTLASLLDIARAVDVMADEVRIRLEINTRDHWAKLAGHHFEGLRNVQISTVSRAPREYREWLAEADAVAICYNFDDATRQYVEYSMANKMPECLASGAATLAYGPDWSTTIDYLDRAGCACVIKRRDAMELRTTLADFARDHAGRAELVRRARQHVLDHLDLRVQSARLRDAIAAIVAIAGEAGDAASNAARSGLAPEPSNRSLFREIRLLRDERFANWIAAPVATSAAAADDGAVRSDLASVGASLVALRKDVLATMQATDRENQRTLRLLKAQMAALADKIGRLAATGTAAPTTLAAQPRAEPVGTGGPARTIESPAPNEDDVPDGKLRLIGGAGDGDAEDATRRYAWPTASAPYATLLAKKSPRIVQFAVDLPARTSRIGRFTMAAEWPDRPIAEICDELLLRIGEERDHARETRMVEFLDALRDELPDLVDAL